MKKESDAELERIREKKKSEVSAKMKKKESSESSPLVLDDAHFNEVVKEHPLMLIDCWAAWCGPCRMISPVVDELARDYSGRITVGKLNVDDNPETSTKFCVVSIPTLLIMKNGEEAERIIGACPKVSIEEKLKKYL